MIAGRRYLRASELAVVEPPKAMWPAISIVMLCWLTVVLPTGVVSAMTLYLLALAAFSAIAARQGLPPALHPVVWPLLVMIAIGLLAGAGADRYLMLKDAWYVSNPGVLAAVGFVLARLVNDTPSLLRAFVLGGTGVAVGHLLWFLIHPELLKLQATQIRSISGTGYYAAGLALLILVAHWRLWRTELRLGPWLGSACLLLCTASVVLSFSRTLLMVMVVGALGVFGLFSRREWLRVGGLLVVLGLLMWLLPQVVDTESWQARSSFLGKLARSAQELVPTERMSLAEINDNWRGYETARAVATWRQGQPWQWLFGQGFGAQVDLGLFQNLSRNPRDAVRFIPIFHNGYVFVLVKTGLVGLILYLGMIISLYRSGRRLAGAEQDSRQRRLGRLLQTCAVVLLVTTWVIAGAFNKFDLAAFMLMIGAMLAALDERARA